MGLDNSKWVEIADKKQFMLDIIIENKINLNTTIIKVVNLEENWVDDIDDIELVAVLSLVNNDNVKFFKKVVDIDK